MHGTSKILIGISLAALTILSTAAPSPSGINVHISIDNASQKSQGGTLTRGEEESIVVINVRNPPFSQYTINLNTSQFDDLEPGLSPGNYRGLEWSDSIRVSNAEEFAVSPPNAVLVSQYGSNGAQNHPFFRTTSKSPQRTFDLQEFFISPAYQPLIYPPLKFKVTIVGFGVREEEITVEEHTVGGEEAHYPAAIQVKNMISLAKIEIILTSQIAPTGAPFEPPYYLDDIKLRWTDGEPRVSSVDQTSMSAKVLEI